MEMNGSSPASKLSLKCNSMLNFILTLLHVFSEVFYLKIIIIIIIYLFTVGREIVNIHN